MNKQTQIIAEVKTESPFGFRSDKTWEVLFWLAESVWDILSIHTNPRWWGDMNLISKARRLTNKPILAKGIHETDEEISEAVERWADYVLVVWRIPKVHLEKCIIEVDSLQQLKEFKSVLWLDTMFVWNSRDLGTWKNKEETFKQAREKFWGWLCQASNIKDKRDVEESADAILIWTYLEQFKDSL